MEEKAKSVYVIGHRNPDTDSICSSIAYTYLKRQIDPSRYYEAKRAGSVNSETEFVLEYFKIPIPGYVSDVRTQVGDVEYKKIEGVEGKISLKKAWESMRSMQTHTLTIVGEKQKLQGIITIGDIAKSYMEVYDSEIVSKAKTPYSNIVETLNGEMVVGNIEETVENGKMLIAAANPDLMESYIEPKDIVILGNRYESQLCAIEMDAQCIIVCDGAPVSYTITKLAESKNCFIIKTPFDTYTAARLVNQSMPIEYFMSTNSLLTFTEADYIDDIKETMAKTRFRDFPVVDMDGKYLGMISRRNLLSAKKKNVILVDHNEKSQAVDGIDETELLEIIDHHRLGGMQTMSPVFFRNQPLGCTATIIYQMYLENGLEIEPQIAGLLCSAIISDTLAYRSPTCTIVDKMAAEALAKIAGIHVEEFAKEMFTAGSNLRNKTAEEIFYQDFKQFTIEDVDFAAGQITSMDQKELEDIKDRVSEYMEKSYQIHGGTMIFFMLTNILEESTELLCCGTGAKELAVKAFAIKNPEEGLHLKGVVSRKKQLVPTIALALQQDKES